MTQFEGEDSFILRGHHISTLTPLLYRIPKSPKQMAQELRDSSELDRGELTAETIDWNLLADRNGDEQYWAAYAYDLVGETEAQANAFENRYSAFLIAFASLSDNAAVRLTAEGMDGMCGSCTFKAHCTGTEEARADKEYMDVFEDVVAYAQTKDASLDFPLSRTDDGDILTTAKAVRRVMAHFAIATTWQDNLYNDALNRRRTYGNVFAGHDPSEIERYYDAYGSEIN